MHAWLQDLRYGMRMLRKNRVLTIVMVASLAIGIGANSAIFSVVDALLLRPLPYPHPDRLANVWLHSPGLGIFRDWPSPGQYIDIQKENHSFEQMALAQSRTLVLTGREQGRRILETSRSGVFSVGDIRSGSIKRVAAGVGDGALVVANLHDYLATTNGPRVQPAGVSTAV